MKSLSAGTGNRGRKTGRRSKTPDAPWPYILNDWLEIQCKLSPEESSPLVGSLAKAGCVAEGLEIHPAFSLAGHMVVVAKKSGAKQFWLYDPAARSLGKKTARHLDSGRR